jgi:hypothetical protein
MWARCRIVLSVVTGPISGSISNQLVLTHPSSPPVSFSHPPRSSAVLVERITNMPIRSCLSCQIGPPLRRNPGLSRCHPQMRAVITCPLPCILVPQAMDPPRAQWAAPVARGRAAGRLESPLGVQRQSERLQLATEHSTLHPSPSYLSAGCRIAVCPVCFRMWSVCAYGSPRCARWSPRYAASVE